MRVAVMQPHYLGYCGLFAMIDSVDKFIFYNDVQFEKQSWQQRNRIKTANGVQWLTVPVEKERLSSSISDININYNTDWRSKHWHTLEQTYSNSGFFSHSSAFWEDFYKTRFLKLSRMNEYITIVITESLGGNVPKFLYSSDFKTEGSKTDRLLSLLKQVDCTEYVSGMAAKDYIEKEKFDKAGIKLEWFDYHPQPYHQLYGDFVPYLSVVDCIFNMGDDALEVIRSGYDRNRN